MQFEFQCAQHQWIAAYITEIGELSQIYLKSKDDTKLDCINYNSVRFSNSDGLHCHVTFKQFTSTFRVKGLK